MKVEVLGSEYEKLKYQRPMKTKMIVAKVMADFSAQMVVMGLRMAAKLSVNYNDILMLCMAIKAANAETILCMGSILVKLSLSYGHSGWKETQQLSYMVKELRGLIVGHYTLNQLGVLPDGFLNQVPSINSNKGDVMESHPGCETKLPKVLPGD